MKTVFELSKKGGRAVTIAKLEVPEYAFDKSLNRDSLDLPELYEIDVVRHYTALSKRAYGVDDGFYPLGSCTMKYNPKLDDEIASFEGFTSAHPLSRADRTQGSLRVIAELSAVLCEITGMDAFTLQPCAGAQGEHTGLLIIRKYHESRGDLKRSKVIVPDSAHGTNPASAAMAGFQVINVKSDEEYGVDLDDLKRVLGDDTAALMLTNPNTLGLFEKNITEIAELVHAAGGLLYYDGANLNAVMGIARPGDTGFDVVHLNLHKTFSTPHGGGGPGSGPVGCKKELERFLPRPLVKLTDRGYRYDFSGDSIGKMTSFYGNFGVYVRAYAYVLTLGGDGLKKSAETAVLNANYLKTLLSRRYKIADAGRRSMHEFVLSCEPLKEETGVTATDIAKGLIEGGIHPPTVYFPLIVKEAMMFEPTETESKETLDNCAEVMLSLWDLAHTAPESFALMPQNTPVSRPDETKAARLPIVK